MVRWWGAAVVSHGASGRAPSHPLPSSPMRVAVVDIGTNSTRLLVADVEPDGLSPSSLRLSRVTRLGAGVDSHGGLSSEAVERTCGVLADYCALIDRHGADANLAVLTSAVRDASDGAAFTERVRNDYGLDARTLSGRRRGHAHVPWGDVRP